MKRTIFLLSLSFFLTRAFTPAFATTFFTVNSGVWNTSSIWLNGQIPPLSGTDTIYIQHHIMFTSALNLVPANYLRIDSMGSLCGHERLIVQTGSKIDNYGELYADSLFVNGGMVTNYNYTHLTNTAWVSNGGSFVNNGGSMQIGGSFLCNEKPGGEAEMQMEKHSIGFFPQPARTGEEIRCDLGVVEGNCIVKIYSLRGELLEEARLNGNEGFYANGMCAGIYFVRVEMENGTEKFGKLILSE